MRIYIAAKFERKDLVREIHQKLRERGHEITYDWTIHKNIKPYTQNQEMARTYSQNETSGIQQCDAIIYLADEKGTTLPMEFGFALALAKSSGKPFIFAIGEHNASSTWYFQPVVRRRDNIEVVLDELDKIESKY